MKTIDTLQPDIVDVDLLKQCKKAILSVVPDSEVVLYGSRARADAREFSDYDILVVVNGEVDMALEEKILDNVYPLQLESGEMFSLMIYSKSQWDSPLYRAMPLHKQVDCDGVRI